LTYVINEFCNFYYLFYVTFGEEYLSVALIIQGNYNNLPTKGIKKNHTTKSFGKKKKVSDN